jgi:hypothetical protein
MRIKLAMLEGDDDDNQHIVISVGDKVVATIEVNRDEYDMGTLSSILPIIDQKIAGLV